VEGTMRAPASSPIVQGSEKAKGKRKKESLDREVIVSPFIRLRA